MNIFNSDSRTNWTQAFLSGIPYAAFSGMQAVEVGPGFVNLLLPARATWTGDTQRNLIHAGCLSVLADTACGLAVGAAMEQMEPFATLDLRMDYLRPAVANVNVTCRAECHRLSRSVDFAIAYLRSAKPIDTFAQCTTIRQGNRVALAQVSIWQDDPQRPVANARGHFLLPRNEN